MPDRLAVAKFEVLREIFGLVQEQHQALLEDRLDRFRELMDHRDGLMDQLQALVDASRETPANLVPLPSAVAEGEQDVIALDAVIRGIIEQDHENEALLAQQMREVSDGLPQVQQGRRAAQGYRVTQGGATYVDRVS